MKKPVIFIVGPTASGKSDTAVILAKKINAQIISCDSMQVYKHMDIATAKVSKKVRQEIKHHLIDVIEPDQEYNVAIFRNKVVKLIKRICTQGYIPLLVGGSGLYMQILLDGIFDDKRNSTEYREKLNREADEVGIEKLYMQLKKMDPEAAKKIHSNDKRRIIRALEVINSLKTSLTQAKTKRKGIWTEYDVCLYGLFIERELLYKNINERVDRMFASGLLEEAKKLQSDYKLSKTARGALGYKELFTYFNGDCTLDEAKELIKRNTRHYAKKQMTWFNKEKRITWIKVGFADKPQKIADKIYKDVKNKL